MRPRRNEATENLSISDDGKLTREDGSEPGRGRSSGSARALRGRGDPGQGGYGTVYRAKDLARDARPVALKVLPATATHNAEAVARFFRESATIARVDHPNIVKFYELGSVEGRFYFTMELVEGTTLKQSSRTRRRCPNGAPRSSWPRRRTRSRRSPGWARPPRYQAREHGRLPPADGTIRRAPSSG